ncbi:nucleolar transcription factor 1-A [Galendromus occidentalis]|uniref:Nucleolar transcription factor 1-A n=1 Tax=Galendromus occidentalis TaxID=34638 RepID=A0AAJ6QLQ2_9ACAR|nr:nucleolar transcription factor 1-A [Galendromus occidentalis]
MISMVRQVGKLRLGLESSVRTMASPASTAEPSPDFNWKTRTPFKRLMIKPPSNYRTVFALFVKENPILGLSTKIQTIRLGKAWGTLSDEEKQMYRDRLREHKATFDDQMREFLNSLPEEDQFNRVMYMASRERFLANRKVRHLEKVTGKPKAALNCFKMFVLEHYRHEDGTKRTEDEYEEILGAPSMGRHVVGAHKMVLRARELAVKWKKMSKAEKAVYVEKHERKSREQSEKRMEWLQSTPEDHLEALRLLRITIPQRQSIVASSGLRWPVDQSRVGEAQTPMIEKNRE